MHAERELRGWKAIAAYLKIPVSSAPHYADTQGMPVRKLGFGRNSPVLAFADELDVWWANLLKPRESRYQRASAPKLRTA